MFLAAYDRRTMRILLLQNIEQTRSKIGGEGVIHPFFTTPTQRRDYHPADNSMFAT